jgi:hypothetical protein
MKCKVIRGYAKDIEDDIANFLFSLKTETKIISVTQSESGGMVCYIIIYSEPLA